MERIPDRVSSKRPAATIDPHDNNIEIYRKQVISAHQQIDLLKKEIHSLEEQKYKAFIRIKELCEEVSLLSSASESK